jgi:hypothetical protein
MGESPGGGFGLMMLSAWTEPGGRLRIRVTSTTDLDAGEPTVSYASSDEEALAAVERWLVAVRAASRPPG